MTFDRCFSFSNHPRRIIKPRDVYFFVGERTRPKSPFSPLEWMEYAAPPDGNCLLACFWEAVRSTRTEDELRKLFYHPMITLTGREMSDTDAVRVMRKWYSEHLALEADRSVWGGIYDSVMNAEDTNMKKIKSSWQQFNRRNKNAEFKTW